VCLCRCAGCNCALVALELQPSAKALSGSTAIALYCTKVVVGPFSEVCVEQSKCCCASAGPVRTLPCDKPRKVSYVGHKRSGWVSWGLQRSGSH
jgi:hypothetical protein